MILDKQSFFLLGIKGTAMSNISVMLKQMGKLVTGVDVVEEFITDKVLRDNEISYSTDFNDLSQINNCDVLVYSAAHQGEENPLALEAKKQGKLVVSQPELIGELVQRYKTSIAVAGCHGKTTTASLCAWALTKLEKNPGFLIGAPTFNGFGGGGMSYSDYFVIEADEYGVHPPVNKTPKLLFLHPTYTLCANIDFDHPDVYSSLEDTKKTFLQFFSQAKHLILCADDPVLASLLPVAHSSVITYGLESKYDYYAEDIQFEPDRTHFTVRNKKTVLGTFTTQLFGEKNVLNALGVIALLFELGFASSEIQTALLGFTGAKRRFELVWTDKNTYLFDDYGHHPAEIEATIEAVRSRFEGKKVHVLFQPHTYSRTASLKDEFATALSKADFAYVLPIFPSARERKELFNISSNDIASSAKSGHVVAYEGPGATLSGLASNVKRGDVVLTMGAGDIYKLKDGIIDVLNETQN